MSGHLALLDVLEAISADLRGWVRPFSRAKGVAATVIALLAIAMGGVVSVFVPLRAIVLAPLPYPESHRLVIAGGGLFDIYSTSFPNRAALASVFSDLAAYRITEQTVATGGRPERIQVVAVTPEFFRTTGVPVARGSDLSQSAIDARVAVVGYRLWETRLGSTKDMGGCEVVLDGERLRVIGVARPGFDFPAGAQVWIPPRAPGSQKGNSWTAVGRTRKGLTLGQANARLRVIVQNGTQPRAPFEPLTLLQTHLFGERRHLVVMLWWISGLFLLLACAGVANLLWANGLRRRQEMATRMTLGASRGRLVRQQLTEALVLAVAGGLAGLGLSTLGVHLLQMAWPWAQVAGQERFLSVSGVILMALLVLISTVLCGLAPALAATRTDLSASSRQGVRANTPRRRVAAPEILSGIQLALALMLLVCSALILRSLSARLRFPLGFDPQDVMMLRVELPPFVESHPSATEAVARGAAAGPDGTKTARDLYIEHSMRNRAWYEASINAIARTAGVADVGLISPEPFSRLGFRLDTVLQIDPTTGELGKGYTRSLVRTASPEVFRVLRITFVAGRTFLPDEMVPVRSVRAAVGESEAEIDAAIVNATFAKRVWPNSDAIGRGLHFLGRRTVVGVVADIHESSDNLDVQPTVYIPGLPLSPTWNLAVRLQPGTPPSPMASVLKAELQRLIPDLPPPGAVTCSELIAERLSNLRMAATLLACFALLGTIVAGLGVYATASEAAGRRTKEMGVRISLGATQTTVWQLAMWRSLRVMVVALPVGVFSSWAMARGLEHLLFEVGAFDPFGAVACCTGLFVVAFGAGLRPALKVAALDPAQVLRCDG